jgi:hypothetical protein
MASLVENIRLFIKDEISKMKSRIYITKITKGKRGKEDTIEILDNTEIFEEERIYTKERITVWETYSSLSDEELFDKIIADLKSQIQILKLDYRGSEETSADFTKDLMKKEEYLEEIKSKYTKIKNNVYDDEGKGYDSSENKPMKLPELKALIDQNNRDLPLLRRKGKQLKERVVRVRKFLENDLRRLEIMNKMLKDYKMEETTNESTPENSNISPLDMSKPAFEGCWLCGDDVECTCN